MKCLRMLVGASLVLGFLSALGLILEYLALCDIGQKSTPMPEWYVVGVCMLLMAAFVISTLITLGMVVNRFDQKL